MDWPARNQYAGEERARYPDGSSSRPIPIEEWEVIHGNEDRWHQEQPPHPAQRPAQQAAPPSYEEARQYSTSGTVQQSYHSAEQPGSSNNRDHRDYWEQPSHQTTEESWSNPPQKEHKGKGKSQDQSQHQETWRDSKGKGWRDYGGKSSNWPGKGQDKEWQNTDKSFKGKGWTDKGGKSSNWSGKGQDRGWQNSAKGSKGKGWNYDTADPGGKSSHWSGRGVQSDSSSWNIWQRSDQDKKRTNEQAYEKRVEKRSKTNQVQDALLETLKEIKQTPVLNKLWSAVKSILPAVNRQEVPPSNAVVKLEEELREQELREQLRLLKKKNQSDPHNDKPTLQPPVSSSPVPASPTAASISATLPQDKTMKDQRPAHNSSPSKPAQEQDVYEQLFSGPDQTVKTKIPEDKPQLPAAEDQHPHVSTVCPGPALPGSASSATQTEDDVVRFQRHFMETFGTPDPALPLSWIGSAQHLTADPDQSPILYADSGSPIGGLMADETELHSPPVGIAPVEGELIISGEDRETGEDPMTPFSPVSAMDSLHSIVTRQYPWQGPFPDADILALESMLSIPSSFFQFCQE